MTRPRRIPEIRSPHALACTVAFLAMIAAGSAMAAGVQSVQEIRSHGVTFVRPAEWESVASQFSNVTELRRTLPQGLHAGGLTDARILITVEVGRSHKEALVRLEDIALERDVEPTFLEIGGWPAIQRRVRLPLEKRRSIPVPESAAMYWRVTTAVAAGNRVLRMEGVVPDAFALQVGGEVEEIGRSSLFPTRGVPAEVDREIEKLRSKVRSERSPAGRAPHDSDQGDHGDHGDHDAPEGSDQGRGDQGGGSVSDVVEMPSLVEEQPGVIVRVNNSAGFPDSEIEVAISNDGRQIVLGNNADDFMFSNDFGASFSSGTIPTPMGFLFNGGDPSFAFAQSGTFYHAFIGFPDTDMTAMQDECATTINRATVDPNTGVMTWAFRGNAVACNDMMPPPCFPDQEHIAADPRNAAPAPGNDQLYSVYRHFGIPCSGAAGTTNASIVCSSDGGATWTAPQTIEVSGDFPRLTVGPNGSVHVVYRAGNSIRYQRYSSCAAGLVAQHAMPVTVRASLAADAATCPMPGNDRCDAAFVSSHTVAVDNLDSTHVYVAYANTTVANTNDDIIVQDSSDSGATWPAARRVRINTVSQARRFMPWMCSVRQDVYVGWYDRRNATMADNSLTDYFVGTARFDPNVPLGVGPNLRLSTASDSQCSSGWFCRPTPGSAEATSCTIQPQLAGICCSTGALVGGACPAPAPPAMPLPSDNAPCDFAGGNPCTAATCRSGGRGCPKYGDYSGIACSASRVVGAWASATSPAGMMPASVDIDAFVDALDKDLRIENLALSSASVAAGQPVTVSYKVFNRGRMSITEDWRENVQLRDPNVVDPNIVIANLGTSHLHTARVNLAVSHSVSQAFTIPAATAPGNYAIRVRGDSTNAVAETDQPGRPPGDAEMNDVSIPITITLGKDLDVRNLSVTPATSSPGATVTVAYEVENVGGAAVTEDWKESIQLRDPNGVLTSLGSSHLHTENLAPAGVHPSSKKVIIPAGAATGAFNIVVKTDSLSAIAEGNETNNEETAALALQAGTKDIVIQNLAVSPDPVAPGGSLLVNYRIVNQGTIILTENWKENVFLKPPAGAETLLGSSHLHTENLAAGAGHNASKSFTIPSGLAAGTYMIIVRGDATGAVAESNETNNDATINVQIQ